MKNTTRKTDKQIWDANGNRIKPAEAEIGRDPLDSLLIWGMIGCLTVLAMCVSVISPLAYIWFIGCTVASVVLIGTFVGVVAVSGDPLGFFIIGPEIAKGGLYIIGEILSGLAGLSK